MTQVVDTPLKTGEINLPDYSSLPSRDNLASNKIKKDEQQSLINKEAEAARSAAQAAHVASKTELPADGAVDPKKTDAPPIVEEKDVDKKEKTVVSEGEEDHLKDLPPVEVKNPIHSFLANFGIKNGMVQLQGDEEGSVVEMLFDELPPQTQYNILSELYEDAQQGEASQLSDDEISYINIARENEVSLEDVVEARANSLLQQYISQNGLATTTDYKSLSNDDMFRKYYLTEVDPDADEDKVEEELSKVKGSKTFDKMMNDYKNIYDQREQSKKDAIAEQEAAQNQKELLLQQQQAVETISKIKDINGVEISGDAKKYLLNEILTIEENGYSTFINKHMTKPEDIYRLAFYAEYGAEYIQRLHDSYRKKIGSIRSEVRRELLERMPKNPVQLDEGASDPNRKKVYEPQRSEPVISNLQKSPLEGTTSIDELTRRVMNKGKS